MPKGGRVHQSRRVNPRYPPSRLGDKYIQTCVQQNQMDIRISQNKDQHMEKYAKSDGYKIISIYHKQSKVFTIKAQK